MSPSVALLAQLIPPALVVAWSPVKVVPALALVLNSPRPRAAGLTFLFGSLASQAAATAAFMGAPRVLDRLEPSPSPTVGWVQIAVGIGFLVACAYTWRRRDTALRAPAWLIWVSRVTPTAAAVLGVVLVITNLKVLAANAVAGAAIGAHADGASTTVAALTWYTVIAGSTIIVPVVGYLAMPGTVDRWLATAKRHIGRHQATATCIVLLVIGIALAYNGSRTI